MNLMKNERFRAECDPYGRKMTPGRAWRGIMRAGMKMNDSSAL